MGNHLVLKGDSTPDMKPPELIQHYLDDRVRHGSGKPRCKPNFGTTLTIPRRRQRLSMRPQQWLHFEPNSDSRALSGSASFASFAFSGLTSCPFSAEPELLMYTMLPFT